MTKRRAKWPIVLLVVVAALVVAVYAGWLHLADSGHRVNVYTAQKVRAGMTQSEVEAIFRAPPGDYSSEPKADKPRAPVPHRPDFRREDWTTEEGGAAVYFGPDGRVVDCIIWSAPDYNGSKFGRVRKWWYAVTVW
jgi:hypothetical protein